MLAYRLTFAMPVKTAYQNRMPQLANFMHVNPPHLWHEHLQIDYKIRSSRMRLSALRIKGKIQYKIFPFFVLPSLLKNLILFI